MPWTTIALPRRRSTDRERNAQIDTPHCLPTYAPPCENASNASERGYLPSEDAHLTAVERLKQARNKMHLWHFCVMCSHLNTLPSAKGVMKLFMALKQHKLRAF